MLQQCRENEFIIKQKLQTDHVLEARTPDMVIIGMENNSGK